VKINGAVISLWGERGIVNKRVRLLHIVEDHTFVILQKDLLVPRTKKLIPKLTKD